MCGGGQDHFLFNYAAGPSGCSLARTLPPSALLSLSPSRTRLGRGLHSPRRSLGSPLLFPPPLLRPRRPTSRTPPPFLQKAGEPGGRRLRLRLRGRRSPDVIAHCISIKQSILDMECGEDG